MKNLLNNYDTSIFLAPMAGVTDKPFRLICKNMGADILITEMVSTRGLFYGDKKTQKLLSIDDSEHPIGIQLFGNNPQIFQDAIKKIAKIPHDFININMGCPTPKIVKNGDGSALMKDLELSKRIITKAVEVSKKPVTIKIRKGWDNDTVNAVEFSKAAEECGAAMIIIHGRTREEYYSGKADWDIIKEVKKSVEIPVIGNGDIFSPEDAIKILKKTKCDGIMIGRGAMGNPWIFREVKHYLKTQKRLPSPSPKERFNVMMNHLKKAIKFHGKRIGVLEMRKHLAWYLKGLPYSALVKKSVQEAKDAKEIQNILINYFKIENS